MLNPHGVKLKLTRKPDFLTFDIQGPSNKPNLDSIWLLWGIFCYAPTIFDSVGIQPDCTVPSILSGPKLSKATYLWVKIKIECKYNTFMLGICG